jgi:hypothetical protein
MFVGEVRSLTGKHLTRPDIILKILIKSVSCWLRVNTYMGALSSFIAKSDLSMTTKCDRNHIFGNNLSDEQKKVFITWTPARATETNTGSKLPLPRPLSGLNFDAKKFKRGCIFIHVQPFYELAVSDLDRSMYMSPWV